MAQTSSEIRQHTDNPYRDPFPGVQLLHCLENAAEGGATTFCDGFAAAEILRKTNPQSFEILAKVKHPFEYRDPTQNCLLRTEVPVVTLGSDGQVERVTFNNRSAASLTILNEDEEISIERYYQAFADFDTICNSPENILPILMQPGDCVVFSNSRVMHGREEYTPGAGRHIQGCYIDHDAIRSHVDWAMLAGGGGGGGGGTSASAAAAAAAGGDVHSVVTEQMLEALASQGAFSYGEGIDMLQHALQAAKCAEVEGESREAILSALFHDVGNSPQARAEWVAAGNEEAPQMVSPADNSIGYRYHADIGGNYIEQLGTSLYGRF